MGPWDTHHPQSPEVPGAELALVQLSALLRMIVLLWLNQYLD